MANRDISKTGKSEIWPMVGPHICNQTGKDLMDLMARSLINHCTKNGGTLNRQEITNFFARASKSSRFFDVYYDSYEKCMRSCKSHNFVVFNKNLYGKFIIDHYFNSIITHCFDNKIRRSGKWVNVFLFGFLEFTRKYLHRDFDLAVSKAYKTNSARHGGKLTITHITEDENVVNAVKYLIGSLGRTATNDSEMTRLFCNFIDSYICKYYNLTGPDILKINEIEGASFLVRVANLNIGKARKQRQQLH